MKYKKWTLKEKLEILSTSEEIEVVETCRKYSVSRALFIAGRRSLSIKEKQA
jgi:putative transposase